MAVPDEMKIDPARETARIETFITAEVRRTGRGAVVLGLSGGLDSAVAAFLCTRALGKENVLALIMPYKTSSRESRVHAEEVADRLGIRTEVVDITPAVDSFTKMLSPADCLRTGNLMARTRMIVLYDRSATQRAVVAGTGNRTEWMLGYTTLHGDSACAFAPLLHLYKCQVRQMAAHFGVPEEVIAKPPTADLWQGQTDEDELGFTYDDVDWLLFNMIDRGRSDAALTSAGFSAPFISKVRGRIAKSEFKRRMPHSLLGKA